MKDIENKTKVVQLEPVDKNSIMKFIIASALGGFLFLVPIPYGTTFTIPIGIVIDWVSGLLKLETIDLASLLVLVFITFSSIMTIINMVFKPEFIQKNERMNKLFSPSPLYLISRFVGLIIVYMVYFNFGPDFIKSGATGGSMLGVSSTLVSVVLCIAFLMPLLTDFGIMEFIGVLVRNVVRPLFTVPGRSAIDLMTSWLGASNAAAILTTGQYEKGF
ncbi:MAG: nucleoside recognition domain-containing protein, partial [Sedimentibacter sp.]